MITKYSIASLLLGESTDLSAAIAEGLEERKSELEANLRTKIAEAVMYDYTQGHADMVNQHMGNVSVFDPMAGEIGSQEEDEEDVALDYADLEHLSDEELEAILADIDGLGDLDDEDLNEDLAKWELDADIATVDGKRQHHTKIAAHSDREAIQKITSKFQRLYGDDFVDIKVRNLHKEDMNQREIYVKNKKSGKVNRVMVQDKKRRSNKAKLDWSKYLTTEEEEDDVLATIQAKSEADRIEAAKEYLEMFKVSGRKIDPNKVAAKFKVPLKSLDEADVYNDSRKDFIVKRTAQDFYTHAGAAKRAAFERVHDKNHHIEPIRFYNGQRDTEPFQTDRKYSWRLGKRKK